MTSVLVVESDRRTLIELAALLPQGAVGAADTAEALDYLEEDAAGGLLFDVIIVQGAAQDGRSGTGLVGVTLDFLRKVRAEYAHDGLRVFVVTNVFDHGSEVDRYSAAFPGCKVFNKASVLNRTTVLPI